LNGWEGEASTCLMSSLMRTSLDGELVYVVVIKVSFNLL